MQTHKILRLVFLMLCIAMTGCNRQPANSSQTGSGSSTLEKITQRGVMRVGYLVWNPCVIRDERSGELSGIYADMVAEVCRGLGVEVEWHETTLANFAAGLYASQYDLCVGPTFVTIPRAAAVSFTEPVAYVGNSGVVRADGDFRPRSIGELERPGLRIAVLQGQALEEYCRRHLPDAELLVIAGGDLTAPLVAVTAGRADIGLMNTVTVANYAHQHPEVSAVLMGDAQVEVLPLAWSVRHDADDLLDFLNSSITYLKSTGRLEEYQLKYEIQLLFDTPTLHTASDN